MKLSIIIVNYNVKFYLEQCLLSVEKAIHGIDAEVVVVDNHSKDGSVEHIEPAIYYDQSFKKHVDYSTVGLKLGIGVYL